MAKWGGTGAESLKTSIDNIFGQNGRILLGDYDTKLVSCTADGASVNFGHLILSGLLTRLGQLQPVKALGKNFWSGKKRSPFIEYPVL